MKAVILAAGMSTRTYPLTVTKPKPMLKVAGKTLLEHNLDELQGIVDEVILVVGYEQDTIRKYFGNSYKDIDLMYVEQAEQCGSGDALMLVKKYVKGKFIVMNGDDLYSRKDIEACIKHKYCVLAKKVENPSRFGVLGVVNQHVIQIIEKPKMFVSDLANTGLYVFDEEIFNFNIEKSSRGEYEIISILHELINRKNLNYEIVKGHWVSIAYPWDLLEANAHFLRKIKKSNKGEIDKNASIKGQVILGEDSQILSGVVIEGNVMIGDNCKIGPNCYIRGPVTLGDGCRVGQGVEIKNCLFGDFTKVPHLSYVGDSVLGDNVNFGAGTIVANLRHDGKNVQSVVKGQMVDSELRKLGVIVGDNVHTGINTSIFPGRKIWPGHFTRPNEVVDRDIR